MLEIKYSNGFLSDYIKLQPLMPIFVSARTNKPKMGFSQVKLSKQMRPLRFRSNCVISLLLVPWSAKINQGPGFCKLWSLQQFSFLYPKAGDPHNFAKNGLTDLCKGLKRLKWNLLMGSWVFPSSYSLWSRFPWCSKFHIFGCHGPAR